MKQLALATVLVFALVGVSAPPPAAQDPQPAPAHEPKPCARPGSPLLRRGRVVCTKCVLTCDEHGDRVEDKNCPAYCRISLCSCHPPCCPDEDHR